MARSKSQPRSKSRSRKSTSKSPARTRKTTTPKSEPKKISRSASRSTSRPRGRPPKATTSAKEAKSPAVTKTPTVAKENKTPASTKSVPKISRSASRSASRSRQPKTPAATPASTLVQRQSRSTTKKVQQETPAPIRRVVTLYRSPTPKKTSLGLAVRYRMQNAANCVQQKSLAGWHYFRQNQWDILVTVTLLLLIGGLFYFFWYNDKSVAPLYKVIREKYEDYTKYAKGKYNELFNKQ